jgi:hypothetical protein
MPPKRTKTRSVRSVAARQKAAHARRKPINLELLQVWSVRQTCQWSGFKYRVLLRLLRARIVPHILAEPARRAVSEKRMYLIPRVPFQRWLNSIGPSGAAALADHIETTHADTGTNASAA